MTLASWLEEHRFEKPQGIDRAYLIIAYDLRSETDRIIRLAW